MIVRSMTYDRNKEIENEYIALSAAIIALLSRWSKSLLYVHALSLVWLQTQVISELSLVIFLSKVNEPGGFADVATSVKPYEEVFVNMFL